MARRCHCLLQTEHLCRVTRRCVHTHTHLILAELHCDCAPVHLCSVGLLQSVLSIIQGLILHALNRRDTHTVSTALCSFMRHPSNTAPSTDLRAQCLRGASHPPSHARTHAGPPPEPLHTWQVKQLLLACDEQQAANKQVELGARVRVRTCAVSQLVQWGMYTGATASVHASYTCSQHSHMPLGGLHAHLDESVVLLDLDAGKGHSVGWVSSRKYTAWGGSRKHTA